MWNEQRLIQRANDVANRNAAAPRVNRNAPPNATGHAALVQQARANLVENEECDHERWASTRGGHHCDECGDFMPVFIFECRECRIQACRSCRYNRI